MREQFTWKLVYSTVIIVHYFENTMTMKHGRGWEGAASKSNVGRGCSRVWAFFFFFFFYGFAPTRLDSRRLGFYLRWTGSNQVVSADDQNGPKQPKLALNHAGTCHPMVRLVMMMIKLSCWSLGLCMELASFCCFCFRFCIGILCVCVYKGQRLRCMIDH